jgi:hypothetical protein
MLLHQHRGLKAIHLRHLHVEQDKGEFVTEHQGKRLIARIGGEDFRIEMAEYLFRCQQILPTVIYDQKVRLREW